MPDHPAQLPRFLEPVRVGFRRSQDLEHARAVGHGRRTDRRDSPAAALDHHRFTGRLDLVEQVREPAGRFSGMDPAHANQMI